MLQRFRDGLRLIDGDTNKHKLQILKGKEMKTTMITQAMMAVLFAMPSVWTANMAGWISKNVFLACR